MDIFMTFYTNRNNIKPMLCFITVPMMILFGLIGAIVALQSIDTGQFASLGSSVHDILCFFSFGMSQILSV